MLHLFRHHESPLKKYVAESLAVFTLSLGVSVSFIEGFPLPTPVFAALVLGTFVYTIGRVSGAHVNPAITVALLSIGKVSRRDAAAYVIAQLIGAVLAMLVATWVLGRLPNPPVVAAPEVAIGELIGTFLLAFGVSAVVHGNAGESASGLVIGSSLLVGILVAGGIGSNGVLNPAVALGIGSLSVFYVAAPILGAMLGVWAYWWVARGAVPTPKVPPR
jgi:glycerol uptake facilitator-like aquaporin